MPNMSMFPVKPKVKKVDPRLKWHCVSFVDYRNNLLSIAAQPTASLGGSEKQCISRDKIGMADSSLRFIHQMKVW